MLIPQESSRTAKLPPHRSLETAVIMSANSIVYPLIRYIRITNRASQPSRVPRHATAYNTPTTRTYGVAVVIVCGALPPHYTCVL
jgi:hypothetical protein